MRYFIFGANYRCESLTSDSNPPLKTNTFGFKSEEFPSYEDLRIKVKKIEKNENVNTSSVVILSITELKESDYEKFWSSEK